MWANNENRLNKAQKGLNLQNECNEGYGYLALSLLNNFILIMCYAIQYHALNETGISSGIWIYNDETHLSSNQAKNNEIMQRL